MVFMGDCTDTFAQIFVMNWLCNSGMCGWCCGISLSLLCSTSVCCRDYVNSLENLGWKQSEGEKNKSDDSLFPEEFVEALTDVELFLDLWMKTNENDVGN